jgi:hypothetical protein
VRRVIEGEHMRICPKCQILSALTGWGYCYTCCKYPKDAGFIRVSDIPEMSPEDKAKIDRLFEISKEPPDNTIIWK